MAVTHTKVCNVTETVDHPVGAIWPLVSAFGGEKVVYPDMVDKVTLKGHGVGAIKRLWFKPFAGVPSFAVDERLDALDPETHTVIYHKIDIPNDPYPGKGLGGIIQLKALGEDKTGFSWTCQVEHPDPDKEKNVFLADEVTKRYVYMIEEIRKRLA